MYMQEAVLEIQKKIPKESYGEYWLKHAHWVEGKITEERFHIYHIQIQEKYQIEFDFKLCPICFNNIKEYRKGNTYDRLKYFKLNLDRLQAIEHLNITIDQIEAIKRETGPIDKRFKKLKFKNLYGHYIKIASIIYNIRIPKLQSCIRDNLILMFIDVEESFTRMNNKSYHNIPNYSYLIYKLLQLMDISDYNGLIRLPCGRSIRKYDKLWFKICEDLDYERLETI